MNIFKKKSVRSIKALTLAAGIAASLAACGENPAGAGKPLGMGEGVEIGGESGTADGNTAQASPGGANGGAPGTTAGTGGLQLLCTENDYGCHTQDGYYYLEKELKELSDGTYGSNLMYMDFAALQEVYLCSNAGCSHNSTDCPSVLSFDDFSLYSTLLFSYQGSLYLFSKDQDQDGSMQMNFMGEEEMPGGVEGTPSILYRANLDGTDREKVYAFDPSVTVEDYVMGDDKGLYLVTKKLTSEQDGTGTYIHSAERRLLFLDPEKGETSEICSMDFGGYISWKVTGCYDRNVVLSGTDYGREVSDQEIFSEDGYPELYKNSSQVFAVLNLDSGQMTEKYRISNQKESSFQLSGSLLYCSIADGSGIREVNLDTGEERSVYNEPGKDYYLSCIMGDKLCCMNLDKDGLDQTYYFIDRNTGELSHSGLMNKSLGWSLDFRAVLDRDVLVVYDYEATALGGGSYDITRYQHGLISQADLFAGNDNFRKISMVGTGW